MTRMVLEVKEAVITTRSNRLIHSHSPYLLQHAHNPVDWFEWGEEAFEKSRREGKPIFLSIGYAACHWCHVMERESFENPEVADYLRANFVAVKVDREERPEVDEVYMTAVQMMTGSGGWPLTVFLTPDLKPFFGGTYFPPESRYGRQGFQELLRRIAEVWVQRRDDVENAAQQLLEDIRGASDRAGEYRRIDLATVDRIAADTASQFDPYKGGFGTAPKFPPTGQLNLLLLNWRRTGSREYLAMVEKTLTNMASGGIYDHLGGGFARYSTDADWLVPHFEKMLYDNALLAVNYLDAGLATGGELFLQVARETLDWALAEMRDEGGGFHSSLDADSEGEEGRYYVWTPAEVHAILGEEDGALFCHVYGVSPAGNFERGRSILHLPAAIPKAAQELGLSAEELLRKLQPLKSSLLAARRKRVPPAKDDKVLADWNGMLISALARAYRALGEERFLTAAQQAAAFIGTQMKSGGRLMHSYHRGSLTAEGLLDDHAFYLAGLVELYQADFNPAHLKEAEWVVERLKEDFSDRSAGGFFQAPAHRGDLLSRSRAAHDGATPPGNAVAACALTQLAQLTGSREYADLSERTIAAFGRDAGEHWRGYTRWAAAAEMNLSEFAQIAVIYGSGLGSGGDLLQVCNRTYNPMQVVAAGDSGAEYPQLLMGRTPLNGGSAAYVCRNFTCRLPVTEPEQLKQLLAREKLD